MQATHLAFAAALVAVLTTIAVVDVRRLVIPDLLNAALFGLGLWWCVQSGGAVTLQFAFAALVMACFWLLRAGFRRLRGTAALGLGDVKMAAACALWFSPWNIALFLFLTAFSALLYVGVRASVTGTLDRAARVPFGPFLGFGLLATWLLEQSGMPTFIPDRGF
jgi:prepilin signal peptidase PulO-like enzyme (type II secretory pathway)